IGYSLRRRRRRSAAAASWRASSSSAGGGSARRVRGRGHHDVGGEQIVVVDGDGGEARGLAAAQVEPLSADVPLVARRLGIGRALAALSPSRNGDGEGHLEEDRIVPVGAKLRTVEKDAVEDED